ncbi:hypothetical protein [Nonomuraea basaltis]|uniref:hypothetical protein n=1 Tax=Nonomuraea basaltis TaxID=2495887 RepID=UPI00110C4CAD|nr:hypothetical protein [Nonomuraea basaltis]TMR92204.1 hypothetical protein EJK15_46110 [Nonomuraea basaltis]
MLTTDGPALAVTDKASGHSVRLTPERLYHYRYDLKKGDEPHSVQGLAALDADGLVLLDLPGDWHPPHLERFAQRAGIPLVDARDQPSGQVRTVLAGRAPGWQRIRGLSRPFLTKWRRTVAICAGVVGMGVMAYLASLGMWAAWRGVASIGRIILDIVEAKWLVVAFSPALLVIRPVIARIHRWRVRQGSILGPPSGPYLVGKHSGKLQIIQGNEVVANLRLGEVPGRVFSLFLYRYDDLTGLFILDRTGRALHHLPGPWPPDDVDRFAKRHGLFLAAHRVSREEYLALVRNTKEAIP